MSPCPHAASRRCAEFHENFPREMQSGGRRGDRARRIRKNSLIARLILRVARAPDVRRQRHGTAGIKIDIFIQRDNALAIRQSFLPPRNVTSSIFAVAPTRILRPGLTRHFQRAGPRRSRNKNSITPSSENLRAGSTRVSFRTSRSPGCRNVFSSRNWRCSIVCPARCSTIMRESSRRGERPLRNQFPRQVVIVIAKLRAHHSISSKRFAAERKILDDRWK